VIFTGPSTDAIANLVGINQNVLMTNTRDSAIPQNSKVATGSLGLGLGLVDADYRSMVDSIADYAIFFLDPTGNVLSWNAGAQALKGYTAAEIIGRHMSVFYPPELIEKQWSDYELKGAAEQGRYEDEGWRLRKDGTRFWASIVITRLAGPDGAIRGFCKITRDLSGRRQQEELLRSSEERFRLMVEGVKDYAIFMLDPSGHVMSWNTGARTIKGYDAAQIIGKHFSVFYPPEVVASGFPDRELHTAREVGRYEEEGWRIRRDGTRFWASVVITALSDAAGQHRGFAKVTRDLTERRRVTSLEDESRRITTFLAMLGHELRNPLAPITNAVAIMDQQELAPVLKKLTSVAARQLKQVTRLVDDLLDVGRITSGKIHLDLRPVRLSQVIDDAVEATKPLVDSKQHVLTVETPSSDLWISADRARLIQVVSNLLNNAAKFTPPGGRLKVRVQAVGAKAEISVSDNGPGIAPEDLSRVFLLFAQGDQNISRPQGGLGLGLTLVRQLVSLQGGEVSAFSKGEPGEGSVFLVQLPIMDVPAQAPDGLSTGPQGGKRVLVVDDNTDAAEMLALLVESLGYFPSTAYDGLSALEVMKREHPDLVLLDIGLPDLSGWQIAQRVRREIANPPILIAVTGYGQPSDRAKSFEVGFFEHLTKPVDMEKLEYVLQQSLKK
jgi:PAS domain S-box-containing protein